MGPHAALMKRLREKKIHAHGIFFFLNKVNGGPYFSLP